MIEFIRAIPIVEHLDDEGCYHMIDGPAVIYDFGGKEYYVHGVQHREDGPAEENPSGDNSWWYNGRCIGRSYRGFTQQDFDQWLKWRRWNWFKHDVKCFFRRWYMLIFGIRYIVK